MLKLVTLLVLIPYLISLELNAQQLKISEKAPEIKINQWIQPTKPVNLTGKTIILDFWATWCGPCIAGLIQHSEIIEKYKSKDVVYLAISESKESPEKINIFLKKHKFNQYFVTDNNDQTFKNYNIEPIPFTAIIDSKGILQWTGYSLTEKQMENLLLKGEIPEFKQHKAIIVDASKPENKPKKEHESFFDFSVGKPYDNYSTAYVSNDSVNTIEIIMPHSTLEEIIVNIGNSFKWDKIEYRLSMEPSLKALLQERVSFILKSRYISYSNLLPSITNYLEKLKHISITPKEVEKEVFTIKVTNQKQLQKHITIGMGKNSKVTTPPTYFGNTEEKKYYGIGLTLNNLASILEDKYKLIFLDESNDVNKYDFVAIPQDSLEEFTNTLEKEYGLSIEKAIRTIKVIEVKKASINSSEK